MIPELAGPPPEGRYRVGVDLVDVAEVMASLDQFGERFEARVFTAHERAQCEGTAESRAASLAARFAAKEATVKVLEPDGVRPDWRSIEIHRLDSGACRLRMAGRARSLAQRSGLHDWAVSLTHHGGLAAAVVVGVARAAGPSRDDSDASGRRAEPAREGPSRDAAMGEQGQSSPEPGGPRATPLSAPRGGKVDQQIRAVLVEHGRLPVNAASLGEHDDLFRAGLTSHASVNVMLALEDAFDVEFPEAMLRKSTFESIASIAEAIGELTGVAVAR